MDLRREGRDFDREVETGQRGATGAQIAEARFRVGAQGLADGAEDVEVALQELVGLGLTHHGLAQQVDGGDHTTTGVGEQPLDEVAGVFAGDKLPGHVGDLRLDRSRDQTRREGRRAEPGLQRRMQLHRAVAEVLLKVADDFGAGIKRREYVDKSEQLGLERRVAHRPLHDPGVGALFGEDAGRRVCIHQ